MIAARPEGKTYSSREAWTGQSASGMRERVRSTSHVLLLLFVPADHAVRTGAQHVSLTLHGHTGPVSSVSVSPASSSVLVLSGSYDGTLRLWDARSPKESLFTLGRPAVEGKGKKVMCVGWSSDGGMIGSGGEDGQVVLGRGNVANPAATGAANGDVQMKS